MIHPRLSVAGLLGAAMFLSMGQAGAAPTFGTLTSGWIGGNADDFAILSGVSPEFEIAMRAADSAGNPLPNSGGLPVTYRASAGSAWTLDVSVTSGEGTLREDADPGAAVDPRFAITLTLDSALCATPADCVFDLYDPLFGIEQNTSTYQAALLPSVLFGASGLLFDPAAVGRYGAVLSFGVDDGQGGFMTAGEVGITIDVVGAVPEPGSLALAGLALAGLAAAGRRR